MRTTLGASLPADLELGYGSKTLARCPAGDYLLVDEQLETIFRLDLQGGITPIAGRSRNADTDARAANCSLAAELAGIAVTPDGTLYFTDDVNHRVCRVLGAEGRFEVVAGGKQGFRDGEGRRASFNAPASMACAPDGTLYVADVGNHRIRRIGPGGLVTTLPWQPDHMHPGRQQHRLGALGWAVDGALTVADGWSRGTWRIDPATGTELDFLETPTWQGSVAAMTFRAAGYDVAGRLVALDLGSGKAWRWDGRTWTESAPVDLTIPPKERWQGYWAEHVLVGQPWRSSTRPPARAVPPFARGPIGPMVAFPSGERFMVDAVAGRVWHFHPDGSYRLAFGAPVSRAANGGGTRARFHAPGAIVVAPDGSAFIAEPNACRVRRLCADGRVSTYAAWHPLDLQLGDGQERAQGPIALDLTAAGTLVGLLPFKGRLVTIGPGGTLQVLAETLPDAPPPWPLYLDKFAALPDGSFVIPDRDHRRLVLVAPDGDLGHVALAPGPHATGRGASDGPDAVAMGPAGRLIVKTDANLDLLEADGTLTAVGIPFPRWGAPWTVGPGGIVHVLDGCMGKYELERVEGGPASLVLPPGHDPMPSVVTTFAGGKPGARDGELASATFGFPDAIAARGGAIWVAQGDRRSVRRIAGNRVETFKPGPEVGLRPEPCFGHTRLGIDDAGQAWLAGWDYKRLVRFDVEGRAALEGKPPDEWSLVKREGHFEVGDHAGSSVPLDADQGDILVKLEAPLPAPPLGQYRHWRLVALLADGTAWFTLSPLGGRQLVGCRIDVPGWLPPAGLAWPLGQVATIGATSYVVEPHEHRILSLAADGTMAILAGGVPGDCDGVGQEARFRHPIALAANPDGHLVVADRDNHKVRLVSPDGRVRTLAGSGQPGYVEGPGASACFNRPTGVAVTDAGDVLVADQENHAVRKIRVAAGTEAAVARPRPAWIAHPLGLLGRRLEAWCWMYEGCHLAFEDARAAAVLDDRHGIIEVSHLPAGTAGRGVGATITAVEVATGSASDLPRLAAIEFDDGLRLRLGGDVGGPVLMPEHPTADQLGSRRQGPSWSPWAELSDSPVLALTVDGEDYVLATPRHAIRFRKTGARVEHNTYPETEVLGVADSRIVGCILGRVWCRFTEPGSQSPARLRLALDNHRDLVIDTPTWA